MMALKRGRKRCTGKWKRKNEKGKESYCAAVMWDMSLGIIWAPCRIGRLVDWRIERLL
jgi:hypothetical protein